MTGEDYVTFTFRTAHHALWAEDLAREKNLPVEVVPAPAESDVKCGIALRVLSTRAPDLEQACRAEGIDCSLWEAR
jgi:hypothetical protein